MTTDKDKIKAIFESLGVKTQEVDHYFYAAGRRFEFDEEGCIESILDYEAKEE